MLETKKKDEKKKDKILIPIHQLNTVHHQSNRIWFTLLFLLSLSLSRSLSLSDLSLSVSSVTSLSVLIIFPSISDPTLYLSFHRRYCYHRCIMVTIIVFFECRSSGLSNHLLPIVCCRSLCAIATKAHLTKKNFKFTIPHTISERNGQFWFHTHRIIYF